MPILECENLSISIPPWVTDLASFRRWVHEDESIPDTVSVHFLKGDVWVDSTMEEFTTHNQIKAALYGILSQVVVGCDLGIYLPDGMLYTSESAGFSTEPDAIVFLHDTVTNRGVGFESGKKGNATELTGTPDLVVEIVSPSSTDKDLDWLMDGYFEAGISEYWVIDALGDDLRFDIHKRGKDGFVVTRKSAGWVKSAVLNRSFQLTRTIGRSGYAVFRFDVK